MALIVWDDTMCIGVEEVDSQHKRLFLLANEIAATLERGFDKEAVRKDLRALCDYAVEHFAAEEALMDMDAYPEYDLHVNEHMQCTTKALDFLEAFSEDQEVDMAEFLQFVTFWIRDHILNVDMTLGTFLRGRGQVPAA
jgi:hemerythrin